MCDFGRFYNTINETFLGVSLNFNGALIHQQNCQMLTLLVLLDIITGCKNCSSLI